MLGTIWRRTPLRLLRRPYEHQVSHYGTRPTEPVQGDWLLGGACLLMRRAMLEEIGGWDAGFRHYVEDIDLAYRAAQAGWERWLVPAAVVHHAYAAVIDKRFLSRHTLWHAAWDGRASSASTPSGCSPSAEVSALARTRSETPGAELARVAEFGVELVRDERRRDGHLDAPRDRSARAGGPDSAGRRAYRSARRAVTRADRRLVDRCPRSPVRPATVTLHRLHCRHARALARERDLDEAAAEPRTS